MPVPVEQDRRATNSGLAQPAIALGPDVPFRLPYLEPYAGVA
jgi:hypothetical protein